MTDLLRANRLLVVCGRAGVGKSTLAARVATAIDEKVIVVALRRPEHRSSDYVMDCLARSLDPPMAEILRSIWSGGGALDERVDTVLHELFMDVPRLLVLENLEEILDLEGRILEVYDGLRQLLENCLEGEHAVRILATSRRSLLLPPDLFARARLQMAEFTVPPLTEEDGQALLRTLDADGRLGLKDAEDSYLSVLVGRMYGLPRSLETLVGTVRSKRTSSASRLLADDTLLESIARNPAQELYAALSREEQDVVCALALFGRPVSQIALRHLVPRSPLSDLLERLARNQAVQFADDTLRLSPLDEQFIKEQIPPERLIYWNGLAAVYYVSIQAPLESCKSLSDVEPHLLAIQHFMAAGQVDRASQVLAQIDFSHLLRWGHQDKIVSLRQAMVGRLEDPRQARDNAGLLAIALWYMGRLPAAREPMARAVDLARICGEAQPLARWLSNLGGLCGDAGDSVAAIAPLQEALAIAREHGLESIETGALYNLAVNYDSVGDSTQAIAHAAAYQKRARTGEANFLVGSLRAEAGDLRGALVELQRATDVPASFSNLSSVLCAMGRYPEAHVGLERAQQEAERSRRPALEAAVLTSEAFLAFYEGRLSHAMETFGAAIGVAHDEPRRQSLPAGLLADIQALLTDPRDALGGYEMALSHLPRPRERVQWLSRRSICLADLGDLVAAERDAVAAMDLAKEVAEPQIFAMSLEALAYLPLVRCEFELAWPPLSRSLDFAREYGDVWLLGRVLHLYGLSLWRSDLETARRSWEEGSRLPMPLIAARCGAMLGLSQRASGEMEASRGTLAAAVELCLPIVQDQPSCWHARHSLALVRLAQDRCVEAMEHVSFASHLPGPSILLRESLLPLETACPPVLGMADGRR